MPNRGLTNLLLIKPLVAAERHSLESANDNSSIEWQPQIGTALAAEPAESSDSEENMDLGDDEPDTMIKKKKGGKNREKGLALRGRINQAAAEQSGPIPDVQKRKAGLEISR